MLHRVTLSALVLSLGLPSTASSHDGIAKAHRRHARRTLPSGWQALGYYTDSATRALSEYNFVSDNLTV